ncbi:MAG TPA: guanylate kinase [Candidatus Paceibacterota bacterium]
MQKQVAVISGPTGSGETTITNVIIARFPKRASRLVTATTRPPRDDEVHGRDYYFLSKDEFKQATLDGRIPEYTYTENRDTYYGSYLPDLEEKLAGGLVIFVNADIVGAKYYKNRFASVNIFVVPESIEALERRIRERSPGLGDAEIKHRKENAIAEIEKEKSYYDYVVVNADGKLDEAVDEVVEILKKEGYTLR